MCLKHEHGHKHEQGLETPPTPPPPPKKKNHNLIRCFFVIVIGKSLLLSEPITKDTTFIIFESQHKIKKYKKDIY